MRHRATGRVSKRYMRAVGALYGGQQELDALAALKPRVQRAPECPLEDDEQMIVSCWMTRKGIRHHHSPNGGSRSTGERAKFARLGTSSGFPDLEIPYARKGYHGLYIEMKRLHGGVLSDAQKEWGEFLISEGHAWYEAKGGAVAIKIISDYFDISD